jgi:hypothetical protein
MIFARSFNDVSPNRFEGKLFNGLLYARTNYLGSDTSDRDTPQALLVEQSSNSVIPAHFHGIDQFQVVVRGSGMLGKHDVRPICIHFAAAYTGYGPVNADSDGIFYFTLRAQSEPGAFFFPEGRKFQKPGKRRNLTWDVDLASAGQPMATFDGAALTDIHPLEEQGLAAWALRLRPGETFTGPDPALGGGQYYVVMDGDLIHAGNSYEKWSCVFVEPPETALEVTAGPEGLEALVLQYPFWEKGTTLANDAPLFAENKIK